MKTSSVANPPEHSNPVVVVELDQYGKPSLVAGLFYKDGKWFGLLTKNEMQPLATSYWFDIPPHQESKKS
jgi:hypothetical protein